MTISYVGSKKKIIKEIAPIIQKELVGESDQIWYIEPFVGGCNSMAHIKAPIRVGCDINDWLIAFWQEITFYTPSFLPSVVTKEEYDDYRQQYNDYLEGKIQLTRREKAIIGFVSFASSYGAKQWGGYARGKAANGSPRNYTNEVRNAVVKNFPLIKDVIFNRAKSYDELSYDKFNCEKVVIYCDPPYAETTKYRTGDFDHDKFWNWCREVSKIDYVTLLVSEYKAPEDFECLWQKEITSTLTKHNDMTKIEKLFRYRG